MFHRVTAARRRYLLTRRLHLKECVSNYKLLKLQKHHQTYCSPSSKCVVKIQGVCCGSPAWRGEQQIDNKSNEWRLELTRGLNFIRTKTIEEGLLGRMRLWRRCIHTDWRVVADTVSHAYHVHCLTQPTPTRKQTLGNLSYYNINFNMIKIRRANWFNHLLIKRFVSLNWKYVVIHEKTQVPKRGTKFKEIVL